MQGTNATMTIDKHRTVWGTALACAVGLLAFSSSAHAAVCAASDDAGGNWASYGRDLTNQRYQSEEQKIQRENVSTLGPTWVFTGDAGGLTQGQFSSTVVEQDGCLVATSINGSIYAADAYTGEVLWAKTIGAAPGSFLGGLFAPAIVGDKVFAQVGTPALPQVVALDLATGAELWRTVLWEHLADGNDGAMGPESSIVPFDGKLFVTSGFFESSVTSHPSFFILDQRDGQVLKKTTVIPREDWVRVTLGSGSGPVAFYSGGTIWGTPAVDTDSKYVYATTGNPTSHRQEHRYTNAIIKIDVDPAHPTFGEIVGSYKGDVDFAPEDYMTLQCRYLGELQVIYFGQFCNQLDADFGSSPTIYRDRNGRQIVAAIQKTCNFHAAYTDNMKPAWKATNLGPFVKNGCHAGAAFHGGTLFVPGNDGVLYALDGTTGKKRWGTKFGDEGIYVQPPTVANGVVYIVGQDGHLYGFDETTGEVLLNRELTSPDGSVVCSAAVGAGVSVSNNAVYAACDLGSGSTPGAAGAAGGNGAVFAYRLPEDGGGKVPPPTEPPPGGPTVPGVPGAPIVAVSTSGGYAPPSVSITQGSLATFANVDPTASHDVTARDRSNGKPLFGSDLLAAGETTEVAGTDKLVPGRYGFLCSIHPAMQGTLEVTAAAKEAR
jgi:polyvinyl alcohol dehydrogenase (cytochrome)